MYRYTHVYAYREILIEQAIRTAQCQFSQLLIWRENSIMSRSISYLSLIKSGEQRGLHSHNLDSQSRTLTLCYIRHKMVACQESNLVLNYFINVGLL